MTEAISISPGGQFEVQTNRAVIDGFGGVFKPFYFFQDKKTSITLIACQAQFTLETHQTDLQIGIQSQFTFCDFPKEDLVSYRITTQVSLH